MTVFKALDKNFHSTVMQAKPLPHASIELALYIMSHPVLAVTTWESQSFDDRIFVKNLPSLRLGPAFLSEWNRFVYQGIHVWILLHYDNCILTLCSRFYTRVDHWTVRVTAWWGQTWLATIGNWIRILHYVRLLVISHNFRVDFLYFQSKRWKPFTWMSIAAMDDIPSYCIYLLWLRRQMLLNGEFHRRYFFFMNYL